MDVPDVGIDITSTAEYSALTSTSLRGPLTTRILKMLRHVLDKTRA